MLIRVEGPCVNVQIGVYLYRRNTAREQYLEQYWGPYIRTNLNMSAVKQSIAEYVSSETKLKCLPET